MYIHGTIAQKIQMVLEFCGLDFKIVKEQMYCKYGKGKDRKQIKTPYFALINDKTNEVLNSVKAGYTISQNEDIVKMVLEGMRRFGDKLEITKGGALNGGKRVYLQLKLNGTSKVANDVIQQYVTIIDSNDGSTGLSVGIGDYTMSCSNEFFYFYKTGQSRFRHTATIEQRIKELPDLIENALAQSVEMIGLYKRLANKKCTRAFQHKLVNHLLGYDKKSMSIKELTDLNGKATNAMEMLYTCLDDQMNSKGDNLWGLHSGVTKWTTHEKSAPRRENGRIESQLVGTNYKVAQKSLDFVAELV